MTDSRASLPWVYKIVPVPASPADRLAEPLPETLPLSALDEKSGFVHLSGAKQTQGTLRHFFTNHEEIYILRLDYPNLKDQVRWESPDASVCGPREDEGMFPHLYNGTPPHLGRAEVESFRLLKRVGEVWDLSTIPEARDWVI